MPVETDIAALFVDADGAYSGLVGVDVLGILRDDRTTRTRHASRLGDA